MTVKLKKGRFFNKYNLKFHPTPVRYVDASSLPGSHIVNFFPRAGFSVDRTSRSRQTFFAPGKKSFRLSWKISTLSYKEKLNGAAKVCPAFNLFRASFYLYFYSFICTRSFIMQALLVNFEDVRMRFYIFISLHHMGSFQGFFK